MNTITPFSPARKVKFHLRRLYPPRRNGCVVVY
nr:MAG TPA: hypothetical protein [Caudoviricetes sp.]